MRRISSVCLITSSAPAATPRLVKEAEHFARRGAHVTIISGPHFGAIGAYTTLNSLKGCTLHSVGISRAKYRMLRGLTACARTMPRWSRTKTMRICAVNPLGGVLARQALHTPADLYIGHHAASLPAVCCAAARHGGLSVFDCEDYHAAETGDPLIDRNAQLIEDEMLSACTLLTAASPLIASAYKARLGLEPLVLLNVFDPLCFHARPAVQLRPLRVYWFSQTIGPGRGIEEAIAGLLNADVPCILTLQGQCSSSFRDVLAKRAGHLPLVIEPPCHPDDLLSVIATHDVGLSFEQTMPYNRDLCLANKVFAYIAAGKPQIMSATSAHRAFAPALGRAAIVVDSSDPASIAAALRCFANQGEYLAAAKAAEALAMNSFRPTIEYAKLDRHLLSVNACCP